MRRRTTRNIASLTNQTTFNVRFSEVDSMQIVWHGEYLRYFEDGREAFGKQYGLGYMDIYNRGYLVPLVDIHCQYKLSLSYGESAVVETRYIHSDAAKIQFEYIIYRLPDRAVVATGESTQVFLNCDKQLELNNPTFYLDWKKRWKII